MYIVILLLQLSCWYRIIYHSYASKIIKLIYKYVINLCLPALK
jgi:hypothetical protein